MVVEEDNMLVNSDSRLGHRHNYMLRSLKICSQLSNQLHKEETGEAVLLSHILYVLLYTVNGCKCYQN